MTTTGTSEGNINPAHLSYLAIYNPSLGPSDETFDQQLVFYFSNASAQHGSSAKGTTTKDAKEEVNERLRRIGLAQGLVEFGSVFSKGEPVHSAETERSRIILHELERGWWLLASIHLTRLPTIASSVKGDKNATKASPRYEYSSREVSPPILLTQQIANAHAIFKLHHGPSLSVLLNRVHRDRFCTILHRYWNRFAKTWDVLLHGNPAVDALSGIKLASGGELGFGVGEEDWGSSERAVLEDMTRQTEGLIDTVVTRFGDKALKDDLPPDVLPWVGGGTVPSVHDGLIFGGTDCISRPSLQSLSLWMRHIYTYGESGYGVRDSPSREIRRRQRQRDTSKQSPSTGATPHTGSETEQQVAEPNRERKQSTKSHKLENDGGPRSSHPEGIIPPPIVNAAEAALVEATKKLDLKKAEAKTDESSTDAGSTLGIPDQYLKYLTLGLSTLAKPATVSERSDLSRASTAIHTEPNIAPSKTTTLDVLEPIPDGNAIHSKVARQKRLENQGHFIIGLGGDLDVTLEDDIDASGLDETTDGTRTMLRTVHVYTKADSTDGSEDSDGTVNRSPGPSSKRLRVVVYARRPFLFCFLFEQRTSSLTYSSFYRTLHKNLHPIYKQLLSSTQPSNVAARIRASQDPASDVSDTSSMPVFDVMYDPVRLTVHATLPNIPEPGSLAAEGILSQGNAKVATSWTRLEALNVHSAILNTLANSRKHPSDLERTSRTSRNWWIVWMRLGPSDGHLENTTRQHCQVAFVIRKASESSSASKPSVSSSRAASGLWSSLGSTLGVGGAELSMDKVANLNPTGGIGFDARKHVESRLSLNR